MAGLHLESAQGIVLRNVYKVREMLVPSKMAHWPMPNTLSTVFLGDPEMSLV